VQSAARARYAGQYIAIGVVLLFLGVLAGVFGSAIADQAEAKARGSWTVSDDVQLQYKLGMGMSRAGCPILLVGGVACLALAFYYKSGASRA